jgi:hypothetical protein
MAGQTRQTARERPAPIPVHDDGDVGGNSRPGGRRLFCHNAVVTIISSLHLHDLLFFMLAVFVDFFDVAIRDFLEFFFATL